MTADYPGPPGPFWFAEFFGWWAVCIAVGLLSGRLLAAEIGRIRILTAAAGLSLPVILAALLWMEIQPTTPNSVKSAVEYSLQAIGMAALLSLAGFVGWIALTGRNKREDV
jgi:hypothetical protein